MLQILIPWFQNLELVDPNLDEQTGLNLNLKTSSSPTKSHATASGTELILNNLFYLTCRFSDQYGDQLEMLWAILASTWHLNLKIICRYVLIVVSLATYEMHAHGKQVICYLAKVSQERCVDELVAELEHMTDSFCSLVDKNESQVPFFRHNQAAATDRSRPRRFDPETYATASEEEDDLEDEDDDGEDDDSLEMNQSNMTNEENLLSGDDGSRLDFLFI
jgi:hypothetical protein